MAQPLGAILQQWADMDIFYYALPFLLIFALVYAILYKVNIMGGDKGQNRGVYAIIAVAVAFMALQFDLVPNFFQIIFPKLGVGLAILLTLIILGGLFVPEEFKHSGASLVFFGIATVIAVTVILQSFTDYSWWYGSWWYDNLSAIVSGIIILVFIAIIVSSGGDKRSPSTPPFFYQTWPSTHK